MKRISSIAALVLSVSLAGCAGGGPGAPATKNQVLRTTGTFGPGPCFKNKAASEGMGQDVFTIAKLTLNSDMTGTNEFELFLDSACATSVGSGAMATEYSVEREVSGVKVIKVVQKDPGNPDQIFWLPMHFTSAGVYVHIDGTRTPASGPYSSAPSDSDIADFVASPTTVGLFFGNN